MCPLEFFVDVRDNVPQIENLASTSPWYISENKSTATRVRTKTTTTTRKNINNNNNNKKNNNNSNNIINAIKLLTAYRVVMISDWDKEHFQVNTWLQSLLIAERKNWMELGDDIKK